MTGNPDEVVKTLKDLNQASKDIESMVFDIVLYAPSGGITLQEAWTMSPQQRNLVIGKINEYNKLRSGNPDEYIVKDGQPQ